MSEPEPPCLVGLDEELLLLILRSIRRGHATRCLCRMQQTCRFFSGASSLSPELSLPELAARMLVASAQALPVRPDGLRPVRKYERGPGESHKQVLQLLESGLLTTGVLHNCPVAAVEAGGWTLAYAAPYAHRTSDADLERVPASARYVLAAAVRVGDAAGGGHELALRAFFRGLLSPDSRSHDPAAQGAAGSAAAGDGPTFHLLAWGSREVVLRETHGDGFRGEATTSENEEDSVFWYRWRGRSFGFSSHPQLWLWLADAGLKQRGAAFEPRPEDRLSWNLETRSTGGFRAGRVLDLGASREWEKRLYYR